MANGVLIVIRARAPDEVPSRERPLRRCTPHPEAQVRRATPQFLPSGTAVFPCGNPYLHTCLIEASRHPPIARQRKKSSPTALLR